MAGNGQLAPAALGYVSGHRVRVDLVAQTVAMVAAAARDGVTLRITQAYRTYSEQVAIFRDRYTTTYLAGRPYRMWNGVRWYQRPGTAVAAVPGTSNHGWGQAIDFATDSPGAIAWLAANGDRYGWSRPDWTYKAGTVEPWHHEATFVLVSNPIGGGGTVPNVPNLPPLTPIEETDMPLTPEDIEAVANKAAEKVWGRLLVDENALPNGAPAFSLLIGARLDPHAAETAKAVWEHLVVRENRPIADVLTYLVDTRMAVGSGDVDEAALAAELAEILPRAVVQLAPADFAALAMAVQDEQDRRERERLAQ